MVNVLNEIEKEDISKTNAILTIVENSSIHVVVLPLYDGEFDEIER